MKPLTTLVGEKLRSLLDLFDLLLEFGKTLKGFMAFLAFFLLIGLALALSGFSEGSFDQLFPILDSLSSEQKYNLFMVIIVGGLIVTLIIIVLAFISYLRQVQESKQPESKPEPLPDIPPSSPDGQQDTRPDALPDGIATGRKPPAGPGTEVDMRSLFSDPYRVFISFAREHHAQAIQLAAQLRTYYQVYSIEQVMPSSELELKTEQAIRRADMVVVLVGNAFARTLNVRVETEFALDLDKPVIYVLMEPPRGALAERFPEDSRLTWFSGSVLEGEAILARLRAVIADGLRPNAPRRAQNRRREPGRQAPAATRPGSNGSSPGSNGLPPGSNGLPQSPKGVPFVTGVAVRPERFIGRQDILDQICVQMVEGLRSISVVADRRMGKTSLLTYLASEFSRMQLASLEKAAVYINMQDARTQNLEGIMRLLRRRITEQLPPLLPLWTAQQDGDFMALAESLEDLHGEGIGLILLLDEWEMVMAHPDLNDLVEHLRYAGSISQIGMVVATAHELTELTASGGVTSPFFNIFLPLTMGLMPRAEWTTLVSEAYRRGGRQVTDRELDQIESLAGGHPALTQMAGTVLWQAREAGWGADEIYDRYVDHAASTLRSIWARLNREERAAVCEALGIVGSERASVATRERLKRRGVLKASGEVFCDPFARIVLDKAL
ncbi:MAG: toll/interleukin-1 receptor domain-containing protein [Anaerolineae bacterium]|nr:toll/interleukin-1 receptor domain-containing protein [Anaerolineae bacterium]